MDRRPLWQAKLRTVALTLGGAGENVEGRVKCLPTATGNVVISLLLPTVDSTDHLLSSACLLALRIGRTLM